MQPIDYVKLLNTYYQGQGYPPYQWSVYETSPWTPLRKPLSECRIALLTSGGVSCKVQPPFDPVAVNDLTFREIPKDTCGTDLVVHDAYYDSSDAERDINCVFPIERFRELEKESYIGSLAPVNFGLGMGRMYKRTALQKELAPKIVDKLREMGVDALFMVAAWPLDHQSVGLLARIIEEAGIPTVMVGSARDMMEQVKAPRAVFIDFPLGHQTGKPFNEDLQMSIIKDTLRALVETREPGSIVDLPYQWGSEFTYTPGGYKRLSTNH